MFARCSVLALFSYLAMASCVAFADEPPRPPQPPFTGETLRGWRDDLVALHGLRDNAFLHEEAASDFNRRLLAWQGAGVILNLPVVRVTKDVVDCQALHVGQITVRNQQQPVVPRQTSELGIVALRIGDVVPLEVARTLRGGDSIVVKGTVATNSFQLGRGLQLAIERGQVAAVVSRSFAGVRARNASGDDLMPVPDYPIEAFVAGADGVAVVAVEENKVALTSGTGNPALDHAVLTAMKQMENNAHLFRGEHRFVFTLLKQ